LTFAIAIVLGQPSSVVILALSDAWDPKESAAVANPNEFQFLKQSQAENSG
jgi:hypothetical protein